MIRVLNRNSIKIIAVLAMILDHVAYAFIPLTSVFHFAFRIIGRITAPIMFMGIANGYKYTSNRFRYGLRLFLFALISQVPYSLFVGNKIFVFDMYNIIFLLFIGFLLLCCIYNVKNVVFKVFGITGCILASLFCEYSLFGISLILIFSLFKNKKTQIIFYSVICFIYLCLKTIFDNSILVFVLQTGLFLAIPLFYLYNDKRGKYNIKYIFYVFYPVHLLLFFLIKTIVI